MYRRYAVFFTPPKGPLCDFGAAWLGWDPAAGRTVAHPSVPGLDVAALTATPRKYGLHATLKAPFRLAPGCDGKRAARAVADLAQSAAPVVLERMAPVHRHGFVALRPAADPPPGSPLALLEARVVAELEPLRAPLTEAELARRRLARLTDRQDGHLMRWGYPFVMEDFGLHLTLTGRVPGATGAQVIAALSPLLEPVLPAPFTLDALSLMGEDGDGFFHLIERFPLAG